MDSIKQNNENSYILGVNIEADLNDGNIMIGELINPNYYSALTLNYPKVYSILGTVQTLLLLCLELNSRFSSEKSCGYLINRVSKIIIKNIKGLKIQELQELRTSLSKLNDEIFITRNQKLEPLKNLLNAIEDRLNSFSPPRIKILRPENANLISNKVFQHLPQISKDICRDKETEASINVGKKEKEEKIEVILKISDEEGYALSKPINQFDSNVIDAVYTLFHNGNIIFSAKDIYEILTGGNKRPEKSPTLLPQIENSLDRLATIRVKIDATKQAAKQHGYEIKKAVLESYMLPLEKVEVLFKGSQQIETAYKLIKIPAIFEYSQYMKQFITIPIELLKLDKATPELICLRIAVLKRVFCICYGNMKYDRLAIETLLKEAGIEIQYKTQKQRYIKAIKQTLELLKDKKFLKDFTTVTRKSEGQKGRPTLQSFQLVPIFKNKELN